MESLLSAIPISIRANSKSPLNKKKATGSISGLMGIGSMATGIKIKCVALGSIISAMALSTKASFLMEKSKAEENYSMLPNKMMIL